MNRREFGRAAVAGAAGLMLPRASRAGDRPYRYVHLDVFTDVRLAGNQLLVFPDPSGLDADAMLALTRESNYSECTFVFKPEQPGTDHRVRIFTRTAETPFAGHPTIGTAFALAYVGVLKPSMTSSTFGLGVGPTKIDLEWKGSALAFAWMAQLKPTFGKTIDDAAALAAAIGLNGDDVRSGRPGVPAAQEVNCGSTFLVVPLATRRVVDAAALDRPKLDALLNAAGLQRRSVYVFSTDDSGSASLSGERQFYSRLLGTGGIEDPATGSAAGPAGCFAVRYGLVPQTSANAIEFLQGVLVRRPSHIHVRISTSGGDIASVQVGGSAVVVGEGTMTA